MTIFDAHCDVLCKLLLNRKLDFIQGSKELDLTLRHMLSAKIRVQNFAIFLPSNMKFDFHNVLASIHLFQSHILKHPQVQLICRQQDLDQVLEEKKIGALLSLEGVESLQENLALIPLLLQLGVRSVGITWNHANWAADGVLEPRNAGFTQTGKAFIRECNRLGLVLDVSHLAEAGFWELIEQSSRSVIASHSNCAAICPHVRNLNDAQIQALIQTDGIIGLTFVPDFISENRPVPMNKILSHIDHVCALGGRYHLGFGSDFDGIEQKVIGLENAGKYASFANLLCKYYSADQVQQFLFGNWHRFYRLNLPCE